ncbi:type 1 fimbrial protein [Salmonella enterica subsp. enterica serovar Give]|uniref:Type 1 fimbrial protein n=1 Tax=Salmonella enterica subsp. enterica serovar Give TaxID=46626 RepID=A0A8E7KCT7_SALET|nr:fimbrial protein [Salmonella enterica]EBU8924862.1 type 1 fimbrial protein [Salmonella enterica subsp. enterica serovar Nima]EBW2289742.1 type 1 fimbrial protein [Salmonella enterica subsp. enterica serovar Newport]EDS7029676.1 type 1 fimbrial protein [Salmonella enterica subsp. enterica]EEP8237735.1 type 1 fimbrial protein [Salmonella enterica subsp. enterica serovar Chester]EIR7526217.1 type 1 fimbrial protein [Salmonella enterica subsp. enterica serovar Brandenburg]
MQNNRISGVLIFALLTALVQPVSGLASELRFKGNLLDRPCQLDPSSAAQEVTFMDTASHIYHVWPGKSYEEEFQIKLVNCYVTTMGKTVELTFKGTEEPKLPGYLQVSGVNRGKLGIGIIDTDGSSLLKLNKVHNHEQGNRVDKDSVTLDFRAFVQATSEAITNKSVQTGDYSSTATFELLYK